ncbi:MAG: DUF4310 family protein [Clostridia bacterium]|nr:DUF4310 family protein [Clostridia bacterium]
MATKKTTKKTTRTTRTTRASASTSNVLRVCSYFALIISAFLFLFGGIFQGRLTGVLNLIGQLMLLVGIGIPAYDFTCGKHIAWRVIYWIALVVYVFGCVFGLIRGF